jgi:hypothetical protein
VSEIQIVRYMLTPRIPCMINPFQLLSSLDGI